MLQSTGASPAVHAATATVMATPRCPIASGLETETVSTFALFS